VSVSLFFTFFPVSPIMAHEFTSRGHYPFRKALWKCRPTQGTGEKILLLRKGRNLIKDRIDRSGMRRVPEMAWAMVRLRVSPAMGIQEPVSAPSGQTHSSHASASISLKLFFPSLPAREEEVPPAGYPPA